MPKYYNVEWTARISGTVEIEAESEADATSKFKASPEAYTDDDQERPRDTFTYSEENGWSVQPSAFL